jgi:predicted ATPase/DNA-binding winged helix-turn-helix (wHTH) protein
MLAQFVYENGSWVIDGDQRELRAHGKPVPIGSRALEIIEKLAESAGQVVSRDELVSHVWRGAVVGENTLRVHIHAIRKALGQDRTLLRNAAGRGYQLLGSWKTKEEQDSPTAALPAPLPAPGPLLRGNLPGSAADMIGRSLAMEQLRDLVSAFRVVTLAGPGGIGKTTLAVELARRLLVEFDGRVCFVELAALADPELVPSAVMAALGSTGESKAITRDEVARAIGAAKLLLVLDNCEHVIDAAAGLAEEIVRQCPHVSLVATSREVMRIDGERIYRVPPLDLPGSSGKEEDRLLDSSAVELFVVRAQALGGEPALDAATLSTIAAICRQLDGIPLAIEFAAAHSVTLGVQQVAASLRDRLGLLVNRRRTPLPRHRTLRATLDWSYELLPESERELLRCLSIFAGSFTFDDACAVATATHTLEGLSSLVDKSLVVAEAVGSATLCRLLDTTRAYALEKLDASAERDSVARRHADHYRDLLERIEPEWETRPVAELRTAHAWRADNTRAALEWAFSEKGEPSIGIAMAAAAAPLWTHLSLYGECHNYLRQALARVTFAGTAGARPELKLHAALGAALRASGGFAEAEAAWERTLTLAQRIGDVEYQLRALEGLWSLRRQTDSLEIAQRFVALAATAVDQLVGERMMGISYHFRGDQTEARRHIERVIAGRSVPSVHSSVIRLQVGHQTAARTFLSRILWLQGHPEQAMQTAARTVEQAKATDHARSLCYALGLAACPIALWAGDLDLAQRYIDLLDEQSTRHLLVRWQLVGHCFRGILAGRRGEAVTGATLLQAGFDRLVADQSGREFNIQSEMALALGRTGRAEEGMAAIEDAIGRAGLGERWIRPELLRIKGTLLALESADGAEPIFREALDDAHAQGALPWELRAATSLAELLREQGRVADAIAILQPVYERFTEGFDKADLKSARALLDRLH